MNAKDKNNNEDKKHKIYDKIKNLPNDTLCNTLINISYLTPSLDINIFVAVRTFCSNRC